MPPSSGRRPPLMESPSAASAPLKESKSRKNNKSNQNNNASAEEKHRPRGRRREVATTSEEETDVSATATYQVKADKARRLRVGFGKRRKHTSDSEILRNSEIVRTNMQQEEITIDSGRSALLNGDASGGSATRDKALPAIDSAHERDKPVRAREDERQRSHSVPLDGDATPLSHSATVASKKQKAVAKLAAGQVKVESKLANGRVTMAVSGPYNVRHDLRVDEKLRWEGDPALHFDLHELVGAGAFGKVFRAIHKTTGSVLAAKVINCGFVDDESLQSLKNEIDLLQKCSHESVVSYYGCSSKGRYVWILMDYLPLGNVIEFQERCGRPYKDKHIASILRQTVLGLAFLHAQFIAHRDIKGHNVLLAQDGNARLADFGIAEQLRAGSLTHSISGSPFFMPPEALVPLPQSDTKGDIWSLAVFAIELVRGNPPFFSLEPNEAMDRIVAGPPPGFDDVEPASELLRRTKISKELRDFVTKCLRMNPQQRPSAVDLVSHSLFLNNQQLMGQSKVFAKMRVSYFAQLERSRAQPPSKSKKKQNTSIEIRSRPNPNEAAQFLRVMEQDAKHLDIQERYLVESMLKGESDASSSDVPLAFNSTAERTPLLLARKERNAASSAYTAVSHTIQERNCSTQRTCCAII